MSTHENEDRCMLWERRQDCRRIQACAHEVRKRVSGKISTILSRTRCVIRIYIYISACLARRDPTSNINRGSINRVSCPIPVCPHRGEHFLPRIVSLVGYYIVGRYALAGLDRTYRETGVFSGYVWRIDSIKRLLIETGDGVLRI